jgi:membrane fusion protein, heavy metal efflux system
MRWVRSAAVIVCTAASACSGDKSAAGAKKTAPATVEHPRTEADLSKVTLTPEAVSRLGIQSAPASVETVARIRSLGGEVVVPAGRSVVVSAPVAGTLSGAASLRAGARVNRGDTIFRLVPLIPSERDQRIESQRAVASAEAEEQAARQRLQRLDQLLKDGAASMRAVEDARAAHQVAVAALEAARERLKIASRSPIGQQGELSIGAPFSGVLQTLSAAQGQTVAASAPLFEVAQVDRLWIRVPIYAGSEKDLDQSQPATVTALDSTGPPLVARRVVAPLKADPVAASVDLFYELPGGTAGLRPGERVTVQLPLGSGESGLVIPESSVVYDIHGVAWVYEDIGKNTYVRRRIEISRHVAERVVVSRGLTAGARVVSVGAAELFGTEFGAGK